VLDLKRREDRWLAQKAWETLKAHSTDLVGSGRFGRKALAAGMLLVAVFLTFAGGDYRITATAKLEGTDQRAIVAALDGFIATAKVRAGDVVSEGDLLATLDERDLELERRRWSNKRSQLVREYRGALASHDAVQVRILSAQVDQAEAQVQLLDEQLARMRMVAPFDGVVVAGDLSQLLGSPVEKGQVLFKIAPLDDYRVILEVDEREIADVSPGQGGHLTLSAMPGTFLPLTVEKTTPISTAEDGRNFFRVEARLGESPGFLRPGMEGIGKVEIDRRSLIWIWTHQLVDWLRLRVWSWWY
jgi:RND family efflux transporter MFP subunit